MSVDTKMLGNWPLSQLLTHLTTAINGSIDAKAILLARVGLDAVGHPRLFRPPFQGVEHLLLEIDSDHLALAPHPLRHGD
jgi:hypothetical protein